MFIEEGIIDWVEICCYLGVNICSGKYFCTDYEERKRKFCATAIIVLFLINLHSLKNVNCTFWEHNVLQYYIMVMVCGNVKINIIILVYHLITPWERCSFIEDLNLLRAFFEVFVCYLRIFILIVCVCYCCMIVWRVKGVLLGCELRWVLIMRMLWGYVMSLILLWNDLVRLILKILYCRSFTDNVRW